MTAAPDVATRLLERLTAGPVSETYAQLAAELDASPRSLKRAVAALRAAGRVRVDYFEHDGCSERSSRTIRLTEQAVCTRRWAAFSIDNPEGDIECTRPVNGYCGCAVQA